MPKVTTATSEPYFVNSQNEIGWQLRFAIPATTTDRSGVERAGAIDTLVDQMRLSFDRCDETDQVTSGLAMGLATCAAVAADGPLRA